MSIAKRIVEAGSEFAKIEDNEGTVTKYTRPDNPKPASVVHVEIERTTGKASLVQREGKPILRHDQPGLPDKIGVGLTSSAGPFGPADIACWSPGMEEWQAIDHG